MTTPHTKVRTAHEALSSIPDKAVVAVGGSGSLLQVPETLLSVLEQTFRDSGKPTGLTVMHSMGLGDYSGAGLDHLAHDGLVECFVGSHFVLSPRQIEMIEQNRVQAVALPAGSISLLYREIASGRPGLTTDIGLGTFVDPRHGGGRLNSSTTKELSSIVSLSGNEWIHYPSFPISVALLRGSVADTDGNITMTDEAGFSDNLAIAQAVRNSGGVVIVEVREVVEPGTLPGALVKIPGNLVDVVVLSSSPRQTPLLEMDVTRTGMVPGAATEVIDMPQNHRLVVARRAAKEVTPGQLVNLGVGMPNGISAVWAREVAEPLPNFTIEQGHYGGVPGLGLNSGTVMFPTAVIDMPSQFDFYNGGGLDVAVLGFAQADKHGNVSVSRVNGSPIGPGGFIDISQKAQRVVFCGSLTGGGLETELDGGSLRIVREGRYSKFVDNLEEVSFNAERALAQGQRVTFITERAVFELTDQGLRLEEVAPGIDVETQVLAFLPRDFPVSPTLSLMDSQLFDPRDSVVSAQSTSEMARKEL